jgi:hypothetical protein
MKINVNGNLWDHLGQKIDDARKPELLFVPVQSNVIGSSLVAGYEAKATVNTDGTFNVQLEADPTTEFRIEARWLANDATDPELQAMQRAEWPSTYTLYPGGNIAALIPPNTSESDQNLIDKNIALITRGTMASGTNLDDVRGVQWSGNWHIPVSGIEGIPASMGPLVEGATFELVTTPTAAAELQRIHTSTGGAWRESINATTWGPWHEVLVEASAVLRNRGPVPGGASLDLMRGADYAGIWHVKATDPPTAVPAWMQPLSEGAILEVLSTRNAAAELQRISTGTSSAWRESWDGATWGDWHRTIVEDDLGGTLSQQAKQSDWLAFYDPTNSETVTLNADGSLYSIADTMGNLPPLIATTYGANLSRSAFGSQHGVTGSMILNLPTPLDQPLSIMMLAQDSGKFGGPKSLVGGGGTATRVEMRLGTDGKPYIGAGGNLRTGNTDEYFEGAHVWEGHWDGQQSVLSIDGALAHRGLPVVATGGASGAMYFGCLYVDATNEAFPWGGSWGAIAIRTGEADAARRQINQMRTRMLSAIGASPAKPWLWPETRALSIDSHGRDRVVVGDPDTILSGGVASITKLTTAILAREYITDAMLDDEVTILAEDEFLTGNAPQLVAGDIATFRVLFQSMLIPSNNVAPRAIARVVGDMIEPSGGQARFVQEMNQRYHDWDYLWAYVDDNPGGGGRMSMRQVADVFQKALTDAFLAECLGTARITVHVSGPNARDVLCTNSWVTRQIYGEIPEWVASKDGTSTYATGTVFIWNHPDGSRHVTVVQSLSLGTSGHTIAFENNKIIEADKNQAYFQPATPSASFKYGGAPVMAPPAGW